MSNDVNDGNLPISSVLVHLSGPLRYQRPQLVQVHCWAVVLVPGQVVVTHAHFTKIPWVALGGEEEWEKMTLI